VGAGEGETARLEMLLADEENRRARSVILLLFSTCLYCGGILEQSMGVRKPVEIVLSYWPARLYRLADSFLGLLKV
jgi:hypothetical protein